MFPSILLQHSYLVWNILNMVVWNILPINIMLTHNYILHSLSINQIFMHDVILYYINVKYLCNFFQGKCYYFFFIIVITEVQSSALLNHINMIKISSDSFKPEIHIDSSQFRSIFCENYVYLFIDLQDFF